MRNQNICIHNNYQRQIQKTNDTQGRNIFNSHHRQRASSPYTQRATTDCNLVQKVQVPKRKKAMTKQFTENMSNHTDNKNAAN